MNKQGYERVEGPAILGDVAVTETQTGILSPVLSTSTAVYVFNNEFTAHWYLYRKKIDDKYPGNDRGDL